MAARTAGRKRSRPAAVGGMVSEADGMDEGWGVGGSVLKPALAAAAPTRKRRSQGTTGSPDAGGGGTRSPQHASSAPPPPPLPPPPPGCEELRVTCRATQTFVVLQLPVGQYDAGGMEMVARGAFSRVVRGVRPSAPMPQTTSSSSSSVVVGAAAEGTAALEAPVVIKKLRVDSLRAADAALREVRYLKWLREHRPPLSTSASAPPPPFPCMPLLTDALYCGRCVYLVMAGAPHACALPKLLAEADHRRALDAHADFRGAITSSVAAALAHLHAHGVVHGNVVPANIVVCGETYHAQLVDYGCAREGGADDDALSTTGAPGVFGCDGGHGLGLAGLDVLNPSPPPAPAAAGVWWSTGGKGAAFPGEACEPPTAASSPSTTPPTTPTTPTGGDAARRDVRGGAVAVVPRGAPLAYRPPEYVAAALAADVLGRAASDCWALGCVLAEILDGAAGCVGPLFPAGSTAQLAAAHDALLGPLPSEAARGAAFRKRFTNAARAEVEILATLLAPEPHTRGGARDVLALCGAASATTVPPSAPPSLPPPPPAAHDACLAGLRAACATYGAAGSSDALKHDDHAAAVTEPAARSPVPARRAAGAGAV